MDLNVVTPVISITNYEFKNIFFLEYKTCSETIFFFLFFRWKRSKISLLMIGNGFWNSDWPHWMTRHKISSKNHFHRFWMWNVSIAWRSNKKTKIARVSHENWVKWFRHRECESKNWIFIYFFQFKREDLKWWQFNHRLCSILLSKISWSTVKHNLFERRG